MLSGVDDVTVEQDSEFEPLAGVSATDDVDGDVTDAVKVSGSVDAAKPGEYVLTYTVSDKAGNTATAERTVTVKAKEGPTEPGKPTEPSDAEPTEPGKPTEPSDAEPTEPSESDDDKTEAPHGQHGGRQNQHDGRQNQHGLSATGASRSAGWSCCWASLAAWYSSAGGVVCRPLHRCRQSRIVCRSSDMMAYWCREARHIAMAYAPNRM